MIIDLSDQHSHGGFRSRLEVEISAELDRLGIHNAYERPWVRPEDGYSPSYLPDFTIEENDRSEELRLPRWVEGKPQQFIYDLFDTFGLGRRVGRHFQEDITVVGYDSTRIRDMQIEELWKPKLLAELSGEAVLVVGCVGATNRLSVEMRPTEIVFSRTHPFVNQAGEELRQQRRERAEEARLARERWERDRARREAEQRAAWVDQAPKRRQDFARIRAASTRSTAPRFASVCAVCSSYGEDGSVHLCNTVDGKERWFRTCATCETESGAS